MRTCRGEKFLQVITRQVPGVAPPTTPYSFCLPKMSKQQKGTPSPGPLRGFPTPGRRLAGGQKLAALKHLSAFFAKRPPRSGGGKRGKPEPRKLRSGRGGPVWPPAFACRRGEKFFARFVSSGCHVCLGATGGHANDLCGEEVTAGGMIPATCHD